MPLPASEIQRLLWNKLAPTFPAPAKKLKKKKKLKTIREYGQVQLHDFSKQILFQDGEWLQAAG